METCADSPSNSPPPPPPPQHRHSNHPPHIPSHPLDHDPHGHPHQRRLSEPDHLLNASPPVLVRRLPLPPRPSPRPPPKKLPSSPALLEHPPPIPPRPSHSPALPDLPPKPGSSTLVTKELQHGGYDYDFDEEVPEQFMCSTICTKVLRDPQLTACCGQHFCQSCLHYWFTKNKKESCPHCREENFNYLADKPLKRKIDELRICCTKAEAGCGWVGELSTLHTHLSLESEKGCRYVEVSCPNLCGEELKRNSLANHLAQHCPLRKYECWYCETEGTYQSITKEHYKECENFPLTCPNNCGAGEIPRAKMDQHRNKCPCEPVQCPFSEAGCDVSVVRKALQCHMVTNAQKHLLLVMNAFQSLKRQSEKEIQELKKDLHRSRVETQTLKRQIHSLSMESRMMEKNTSIIVGCLQETCPPNKRTSLQSIKTPHLLRKRGDKIEFTVGSFSHYSDCKEDWYSPFFYYKDYDVQLGVSIVYKDGSQGSFSISFMIHVHEEPPEQIYEPVCSDSVKVTFEDDDGAGIYNALVRVPIKKLSPESKEWYSVTPVEDALSLIVQF